MKTFGEIVDEVLRLTNRTDEDKRTVVKEAVNRRYREILQYYNWPELLQESTVTAGSEIVGLPQSIQKIIKVYDRTNNRVIVPLPDQDLTERYVDALGESGSPQYYSRMGNRGVLTQLSTPTNRRLCEPNRLGQLSPMRSGCALAIPCQVLTAHRHDQFVAVRSRRRVVVTNAQSLTRRP